MLEPPAYADAPLDRRPTAGSRLAEGFAAPVRRLLDEAGQIANTVAHESRHAEQHFLRGRYLAGTGMAAPEVICVSCHKAAGSDAAHSGHDYVYTQVR